MSSDEPLQPYEPLRQVADGLWVVDGDWFDSPLRRRMTLLRLGHDGLLVHNAFRLRDDDHARVAALGEVRAIVAPNRFHASEAHAFKARHPRARLYCASAALAEVRARCEVDAVLPGGWDLAPEVEAHAVQGLRFVDETVLYHRASRTLVVTDLVFNLQREHPGLTGTFLRWNRIDRRFGPSRLFSWCFVRDRAALTGSLREVLRWDVDRVVMNHGDVLETGGREALRRGFAEIGVDA